MAKANAAANATTATTQTPKATKPNGKSLGVYRQQFTHGGFHDFETELTINREDEVELFEPIGNATRQAIANNRLVRVFEPKAKVEAED